jgi:hypothetical protein
MVADHLPDVIFHMGMHKTGSTSYQVALSRARDELKARGVLYPHSIEGAVHPQQHADVAHLVLNLRKDDLRKYLLAVKAESLNHNYSKIIFSSEDFSSFGNHKIFLKLFTDIIDEIFPQAVYVFILRNAVDHLSSSLSQRIAGNVMNVNNYNFGEQASTILMARAASIANIKNHLGSKLVFLDYNRLIGDGSLCRTLHAHIDIGSVDLIHEARENVASEKDIINLVTSCLRGILSLSINEPVYSQAVFKELNRFVDSKVLRSAMVLGAVDEFKSMYSAALKKVASEVVAEAMPRLLKVLSVLDDFELEYYIPGSSGKI